MAKLYAHAHEPVLSAVEALPDLPADWDDVVRRALAKDPADRFPSAGDLSRAALAAAAGRSPGLPERSVAVGAAAPPGVGETVVSPRGPRRRRRLWAVAAAGLAAAAVAITVALAGGGDTEAGRLTQPQYEDRVLDAARPYLAMTASAGALPEHITAPDARVDAAATLASLRKALDRSIRGIDGLRPPADVDDLHSRVLELLRASRTDLAAAGAAADFGNDRDYRAAVRRVQGHGRRLDALAPEFRARGYSRLGQPSE